MMLKEKYIGGFKYIEVAPGCWLPVANTVEELVQIMKIQKPSVDSNYNDTAWLGMSDTKH